MHSSNEIYKARSDYWDQNLVAADHNVIDTVLFEEKGMCHENNTCTFLKVFRF